MDIVERLRADAESTDDIGLCADAADEIARLRQQVATLTERQDIAVEALNEINNWLVCACIATPEDMAQSFDHMQSVADKALDAIQSSEVE